MNKNVIRTPENNNASKLVECHEASQLFSAILVPDVIIFLLLLWFLLRIVRRFCKPSDLNNLVDEIRLKKKPDKFMNVLFLLIPIIYVTVSLVASIINLFAFNFVDDDVIIHWPGTSIYGSSKATLVVLSLIGFIAIDVFYIQLIIKYAFQCKLNIYYLEEIIRKIDNLEVIRSSIQNHRNIETYKNQGDALKDIKRAEARGFLKTT